MALQDDIRTLSALPAFRELDLDALRLVAFSAESRILRAGDVLFREGDTADAGYVLLGGRLSLESASAPSLTVTPPALLGETAMLTATVRPATARALEPTSILKVSQALYLRVLSEYPDSAVRVRKVVAARLLALRDDCETVRELLLQ